jgi:hypothetical protein
MHLRAKLPLGKLAELADNLSANCPQNSSVVEVQRHTDAGFSFESHPLRHFLIKTPEKTR